MIHCTEPLAGVSRANTHRACPVSDMFNAWASLACRSLQTLTTGRVPKPGLKCVPKTIAAGSPHLSSGRQGSPSEPQAPGGRASQGSCCLERHQGRCPSQAATPRLPGARAGYPQTLNGHPQDAKHTPQRPRGLLWPWQTGHAPKTAGRCGAAWPGAARDCRQRRPGGGEATEGRYLRGAINPSERLLPHL